MAENSNISWCDHTFNPWIGCQKVSPGCDSCYAEALMDTRFGKVQWGPEGERKLTSDANWRKPLTWNRKAATAGERPRVFCASLADVFDNQAPQAWRRRLWSLILDTPNLDWLLLTKRPQNISKMMPWNWLDPGGVEETRWRSGYWSRWNASQRLAGHVHREPGRIRPALAYSCGDARRGSVRERGAAAGSNRLL